MKSGESTTSQIGRRKSPKMGDKPVPITTKDPLKEITDRRMRWPTLNLMTKEFTEYLQKSTGSHKESLMEMLKETNRVQLKNISTIREVLVDLKTQIREAESTDNDRLRKLKNKQVWEMVDETTNTINDCNKTTKTMFYDMEALLNMWEIDLDEERLVVLDHIEEDTRMQNGTADVSLKGLIRDCEKTCGERKTDPEPENKFKSSAEIENKWCSKPGKTKEFEMFKLKPNATTLDFINWVKNQKWWFNSLFEGTVPDTVLAKWQFKFDLLDKFWIDKVNARVEELVYWNDAMDIVGEEVELMDPPMKRWNRYLKAKQQPNVHPTQWIERVNKLGKACNYKTINPGVLRMLIIYIGLLEG